MRQRVPKETSENDTVYETLNDDVEFAGKQILDVKSVNSDHHMTGVARITALYRKVGEIQVCHFLDRLVINCMYGD